MNNPRPGETMFDFAWSEFALIGIVGLLFIGPKDMPVAIRTVTNLLKKGRKLAGEFQTHVDEMVREADLGEARDQLRQLRSFNVRGQIMKALDEDGSLKRTLTETPVAFKNAAGSVAQAQPQPARVMARQTAFPPRSDEPASGEARGPVPASPESGFADGPAAEGGHAAPSILPPDVAARIKNELDRPDAPRFLPPQPRHANPAVNRTGTR